MDRTAVRMTTLKEQDEALCLSLSLDDRLRVLEELNRMARSAAGFAPAALDRSAVRVVWRSR